MPTSSNHILPHKTRSGRPASLRKLQQILSILVVLSVFWGLKLTGITLVGEAFCGINEHVHDETCYERQLICSLEEQPGHTHGPECFPETQEATTASPEETDQTTVAETACTQTEQEGHSHSEECYHTTLLCQQTEHTHIVSCYSDISADLESSDVWEDSFAHLVRGPSTAENIIALANSQLGNGESTRNFQVDANGIRRGITRYGQWYGNPYGDWSAMFASFCLRYSGVDDVPVNAGAESMRLAWEDAGLYQTLADLPALMGNLVFIDTNGDGAADRIAIITDSNETTLFTVEGDVTVPSSENTEETMDVVAATQYLLTDPSLMGYGEVPAAPGLTLLPQDTPTTYGPRRTIWLDGTNGGLMALGDSPNKSYTAEEGTKFTLPATWDSPSEYGYTLIGWYDVLNSTYYQPGEQVTVQGNMLFYADWIASTYDFGRKNSLVANTLSTDSFITTRMFDYGVLFNVQSTSPTITIGDKSHSDSWKLVTSGKVPYKNATTLNYIFRDWDANKDFSWPTNVSTSGPHYPTSAGKVYSGLYTEQLGSLLFDPKVDVIGKHYLGTADHLFQLCEDSTDPHFGYYYYDSALNAASYNQTDKRFYVYNYLEQTTVSNTNDGISKYSDFLPLNSPYVLPPDEDSPATYSYAGKDGSYKGVTHYMYDATDSSNSDVASNFFFGMSLDIDFYLPNKAGSGKNHSIYGTEMHFKFSGDDDVWVFVDGKMVLDLGGIHGIESGDVNFSSGVVTINGVVDNTLSNTLKTIEAGEHVLTMYYLERGSSMSNCAVYFNLAPRFFFTIQKEDFLTSQRLNGAQFSVYTDPDCTIPAQLWTDKDAYLNNQPSTHVFTVIDGEANLWGMGAGNTYYIRETRPPDDEKYGLSHGIICLTFDKNGTASFNVEIIDDGEGITPGFTVHGFRIDEETQHAYIVVTNATKDIQNTTSVYAKKVWDDDKNHSAESIIVYLTSTDENGTVHRLQEAHLGTDNNWRHQWSNLPRYREDGVTEIPYGVEEAYIPGYYSKVELVDEYVSTSVSWGPVSEFTDKTTYLIKSSQGYLSTLKEADDTGYQWVEYQTALNSKLARWVAEVKGETVRLTNEANQTITFYYGGGRPTDFYASTGKESTNAKQYFHYKSAGTQGLRIYYDEDGNNDYDYFLIDSMNNNKKFGYSTTEENGIVLTPITQVETTVKEKVTGWAFLLTNIPLTQETSFAVEKIWDYGEVTPGDEHLDAEVTVRLLADGLDTGRTVTLNLQNGWSDVFRGLPYLNEDGEVIQYSVVETWNTTEWIPVYGDIQTHAGTTPTYSTIITNQYQWATSGPVLPSTGTMGRGLYQLVGAGIMLISLGCAIAFRRKRTRQNS